MKPLWGIRSTNVQFTSNSSQSVSVDIISEYKMRDTVSCRIYIYSILSELRILFQWQNIGLTISGNKFPFHIQCYLMRALQRDLHHRSLFPVLFMMFWFWAFFSFSTLLLMLSYKPDIKRNSYVCDRSSCLIFKFIF
jgi:hypothetical protein